MYFRIVLEFFLSKNAGLLFKTSSRSVEVTDLAALKNVLLGLT
jgi:hypothetical protein